MFAKKSYVYDNDILCVWCELCVCCVYVCVYFNSWDLKKTNNTGISKCGVVSHTVRLHPHKHIVLSHSLEYNLFVSHYEAHRPEEASAVTVCGVIKNTLFSNNIYMVLFVLKHSHCQTHFRGTILGRKTWL